MTDTTDQAMTLQELLERMEPDQPVELVSDSTLPRYFWGQIARLGEADPTWTDPAALILTSDCEITAQGPDAPDPLLPLPLPLHWWAGEDAACALPDTVAIGDISLVWILEEDGERGLYVSGELAYESAPPQLLELAMAVWRLRSYAVVLPVQLELGDMTRTDPHPDAPDVMCLEALTLTGISAAFPSTFPGSGIILSEQRLGPLVGDPRVTLLFAAALPDEEQAGTKGRTVLVEQVAQAVPLDEVDDAQGAPAAV